jgi:hypothetical protein
VPSFRQTDGDIVDGEVKAGKGQNILVFPHRELVSSSIVSLWVAVTEELRRSIVEIAAERQPITPDLSREIHFVYASLHHQLVAVVETFKIKVPERR